MLLVEVESAMGNLDLVIHRALVEMEYQEDKQVLEPLTEVVVEEHRELIQVTTVAVVDLVW